jgi:hypothetical protein
VPPLSQAPMCPSTSPVSRSSLDVSRV